MAGPTADSELERIYGLPLDEFTAARNDAAKKLKAAGDDAGAKAVKAAKKPTRPAWIVNTLARSEPKKIESLLKAGERLREAQEDVFAGKADPDQLRMTAAAEQREIDALLDAASGLDEVSPASLDRVGETFQAAARDPELAETIRAGTLDRERRATSLGGLGTAAPAPRASKAPKTGADEAKAEREEQEHRAAVARRKAERRADAAEKALERAEAHVKRVEADLAKRQADVEEARAELEDARKELGE